MAPTNSVMMIMLMVMLTINVGDDYDDDDNVAGVMIMAIMLYDGIYV